MSAPDPLQRVLGASEPLTLAGVPSGFLPWLAADLTRAVHSGSKSDRVVLIAADEGAMRALADTSLVRAGGRGVRCRLGLPPYDRASPALGSWRDGYLMPQEKRQGRSC